MNKICESITSLCIHRTHEFNVTKLQKSLWQKYNYLATVLITINYQLKIDKKFIFTKM